MKETMRVCRRCDEVRPADDFYPTSLCCKRCVRERSRAYDQAARRRRGTDGTGPKRISAMSAAERRAYWATYKRRQGCTDCGLTDWRELEFDHLPQFEKSFTIGEAMRLTGVYSDDDIAAEVAKCEVVCRSCHVERTRMRSARRARDLFSWDGEAQ